jgi:nicotinate-nucleotide pyrophosphorylase (carboxylating)
MLEKYAVLLGGGCNHRYGLDDGVVIRANHAAIAGGLAAAVKSAKENLGRVHKIEVQVTTEGELRDALANGADMIILENTPAEEVGRLVSIAREKGSDITIQCTGPFTLENVRSYAEAGADLIGIGALTSSARAMEIAFQVQPY